MARINVLLIMLLAVLSNLIFFCSELPLIQLAEYKLCYRRLKGSMPVEGPGSLDSRCKDAAVQNDVAFFIGFRTGFDAIPPLLTSLWYGSLADQLGRKSIVTFACTGEILNLLFVLFVCFSDSIQDIRWAWLAAFFLFIGGGQFFLYAMFCLMIVDMAQESEKSRTRYLATLHSITLLSSLVGAPISALLLKKSLAAPFLLVISLAVMRYPVIWILSETTNRRGVRQQDEYIRGTNPTSESTTATAQPDLGTEQLLPDLTSASSSAVRGPRAAAYTLLRRPLLVFAFLCFLVKRVAFTSEVLMYQAVAERLGQNLEETAWLRIPIGVGAMLTLLLLLPAALRRYKAFAANKTKVDIWAVRVNLAVLVCGFTAFWVCEKPYGIVVGLFLCGAGEGLAPSLQGLAASLVNQHQHSDLFAAISVVDTIAKLIGGPLMAATFSVRDDGGRSYGLCFLLSTMLFTSLFCLSWSIDLRPPHVESGFMTGNLQ